jgi:hypothetical protein
MISIKIQCVCGQSYAFEVEPVGGRMPKAVRCPTCGTDGTTAANAALARAPLARPTAAAANAANLPVAAPARPVPPVLPAGPAGTNVQSRRPLLPGQPSRAQALHEARAKMLWGDSFDEVFKFLRMQGYSHAEASAAVTEMFQERVAIIRTNGIRKIVIGSILICIPVILFLVLLGMGFIFMRLLALPIMVGVYGVWLVVKGTLMLLAPKSEVGDASEM